ncbi:MAG: hypothetical protein ACW99Q_18790, partial [Candidatus Kariarchaeaceae archaeon]
MGLEDFFEITKSKDLEHVPGEIKSEKIEEIQEEEMVEEEAQLEINEEVDEIFNPQYFEIGQDVED